MSTKESKPDTGYLAADGEPEGDPSQPSFAPPDSLWAMQEDVDFFLPPALSFDTIDYLRANGDGLNNALWRQFGLRQADDD
jgi:hypothetical protein